MPRTLFARLLLRNLLLLATLLASAGFLLDHFLLEHEVDRLAQDLQRHARAVAVSLAGTAPGAGLQAAVRAQGAATGLRFTLIAADGTVLADSHHAAETMEDHASRPEIAAALAGRTGRSIRTSPTLGLDMLYVALPGRPVVRAALPLLDVQEYRWQIRQRILWAALPATLLALLLALLLARSLTRRLHRMTAAAGRLAHGDYVTPLEVTGNDDLATLERSLAILRGKLSLQVGQLQRDHQRLRALLDGLPDAVVLLDGERCLAVANTAACDLLRLPQDRLRGLAVGEVLRLPPLLTALDAFPATSGGAEPEPIRVAWPEPPRQLEVVLRPLADTRGRPGVLVVLHDITRRAHLEQVRTDFIANLSHELRTPLTAVRGAAETLQDGALAQPAAAARFLDTICRHCIRLETLLADVSDLARIEAGGAPTQVQQIDARQPARQVVELFAADAERRHLHLEADLGETELSLTSDPAKIEGVLVNLVQNSLRYTAAGGRVVVTVAATATGIRYRVADTGIGILPADLPRVTERFYRVDPSRSRAQGGTGLGLSIVKHQVEELGGHLTIDSEYGVGTRVTVTLPQLEIPPDTGR